jgi:hypothetical protein
MAIQTPPEPPQASQDYKNAKAQAKAAKAYAKAQRPWYKKKRFLFPLGLVLLVVVVSAGSSGGDSDSSDTTGEASGGDGTSGNVGQALTNAGTTYMVTKVRTTDTIGDPDLGGARADGMFVVVSLELTNNKDETKTFLDNNAKIESSDGKEYETSDKTVLSFGDESLLLKDIQPDLTTRGKLAFELPPNKVSGSTLVIEDLFGSGDVRVDLGL